MLHSPPIIIYFAPPGHIFQPLSPQGLQKPKTTPKKLDIPRFVCCWKLKTSQMGPLAGGAQGGAPPTCTTGTHIHIHRCVLRCMGIYRYATSIDKYCYDILNSIILQCTNDWGRYSSYENGGGKFVPVEERIRSSGTVFCFQWNAFPQQQMLKNSQEIAIIASPALPLEAFPPSSGSENGCHFIEMPPRFLPSPPIF